jgi:4-amino-4-deoxy-L-arabinose transferase-like glycosyltransferase
MNADTGKKTGDTRSSLPLSKVKVLTKLTPDTRFYLFLLALALIVAGQIIMHRDVPIDSWQEMRQSINDWLRVDAKYLGNVIFGVACSILGGLIFAIINLKSGLFQANKPFKFQNSSVPILKKIHLSKWIWRTLLGVCLFAVLIIRAVYYELEFFDVFFWVFSIFLISRAIFKYDKASGVALTPKTTHRELGIIILILIVGFLIGAYQLQDIPNIIKGDEGSFFEIARYFAKGEYHESIFGFGVYSFPAFSSFVQGAIMRVFGLDIWGWRFSSLLPALLCVVPLYLIGRDFFNRWVGILSSIIYISSPYYLSFARLGYNNSQAILFVIICFWLFYQGIKRKSLFYMYLGGIASGLGFLTYSSGKLGLVIVLVLFGYTFLSILRKKGGKRFLLIALLVFLVGSTIIAAPHMVYGASHNPEALRNKLIESLFINLNYGFGLFDSQDMYQTSTITTIDKYQVVINPELNARLLLRGFIRSFLGLQFDEFNNNFFLSSSLAGPISVVFYVLGLYFVLAHFWKPYGFPFLVWFITGMFFLSIISTYPPRPAHLVVIIPILALFSGLGVFLGVEQVVQYFKFKNYSWNQWRTLIFLLCSFAILVAGVRQYFVESPKIYKPNLEQVMNWAGLDNPRETKIYYIYGSEVSEDWVPYFFRIGLAQPEFESIALSEVQNGTAVWPGGSDFAIFIEEYHTADLLPLFRRELYSGEFITLRDRDERPIGRIIVNGNVNLSTKETFWGGIGNLLTSRILWIILPLIAVGLYQLYQIYPDLELGKLKSGFSASMDKIGQIPILPLIRRTSSEKQEGEATEKSGRSFEIGFFLHWGFRKTQHDCELKISLGHRKDDQDSQLENKQT